ncbi:MAG TPA: glycosyl hydrolase, partial [Thermoanaerobaculia bacterium]|nr:glycosyl hydrolase [Thermoanaerobaculia bacterium]
GVYRSTDAGETWQRVGLEASERVARIAVHPKDGNVVWVCATGALWSSHPERGVYKTADGGKSWKRVLGVDADTGCSDLAVDPQDPRILYAGMWQFRRTPWSFDSGGAGSGLYKSTDGGETWRELEKGLPAGEKGRIAVAVAPSRPSVVYTLVEAEKTALYRSDDVGESWAEVNSSFTVSGRPFYFALVVVDPTDFDRVYKPGFTLGVSSDGGRSFGSPFSSFENSVHSDHHALWIDPRNPQHLLLGTDGGLYISYDRGRRWRMVRGLPISQFYRVSYDMAEPYNVYGGLQDNGSWRGPSRSVAGIQNRDWENIGMGDGFYAFADPADPEYAYVEYQGGMISRLRLSTGERKEIRALPREGEEGLRFNWNTPIHLSPNENGTIYLGSQYLLRSRDRGDSWERISPDLTTNDPRKQQQATSGGLTIDNSTAENHTTIYAIAESPKNGKVIWAGTDDGNLQVTRDGGATWANVAANVPGVPRGTWVSGVEASPHDEATAFATFDVHATGDMKTYVYRTTDFGRTWTALMPAAIPEAAGTGETLDGYAHVIRQDVVNPDLLFLGTETGLFVSIDGGARWARFTGNLPRVAVRDLAIHPRDSDLIIATHGRGIYILDDITPLRALTREVLDAEVALLPSRPSALAIPASIQDFAGDDEFVGANPPEAAAITYYLKKRHLFGDLKLEVYDAQGAKIATLPGGKRRGINRVAWPMRLPAPKLPPANSLVANQFTFVGPRVPAGPYMVKLVKGDQTLTGEVRLVPDPRSTHPEADRTLQQRTAMELYRRLEDLTYVVDAAVAARDGARQRAAALPAGDRLRRRLEALAGELETFRNGLVASGEGGMLSGEEQLREKLGDLYGAVNGYEGRPTQSQIDYARVLDGELERAAARFEAIRASALSADGEIGRELARRKLEPIRVPSREEWQKEREKG